MFVQVVVMATKFIVSIGFIEDVKTKSKDHFTQKITADSEKGWELASSGSLSKSGAISQESSTLNKSQSNVKRKLQSSSNKLTESGEKNVKKSGSVRNEIEQQKQAV